MGCHFLLQGLIARRGDKSNTWQRDTDSLFAFNMFSAGKKKKVEKSTTYTNYCTVEISLSRKKYVTFFLEAKMTLLIYFFLIYF